MYAYKVAGSQTGAVVADIVTKTAPSVFPTVSDGIEGLLSGQELSPGSVIIVSGSADIYIMNDQRTWDKI